MRTTTLPLLALAAALAAAPHAVMAQKQPDTTFLKDYSQTRGFMLGRPVRPKVAPDGKTVLFLRAKPRQAKMSLFELDVSTGKARELLTPEAVLKGAEEKLTPEEKARRERQRVTVGGFATYDLSPDGKSVLLALSGRLYLVPRDTAKAVELNTSKGTLVDPKFSPDGKLVSYVLGHDIYVIDPATQKETRVTTGGTAKLSNGLAEFVAQEEMGRFTGYWWSPDSKFIAYQQTDAKGVEVWYVADPIDPAAPPHPTFYPRPGKSNVEVKLGIVKVTGGKTRWVDWNRKTYPYLTNVHWQKGGLTVALQTRLQQALTLAKYNTTTGKLESLLHETDPAWLNLNHDKPHWLADGSFLWHAETRKGPELHHRGKDGKFLKVVVPAGEGFLGVAHVDQWGKQVFYRASANPTEQHLFRVPIAGGKPTALSKEPGLHAATFNKAGEVYVHTASTLNEMPRSFVYQIDGTKAAELPSVAEEPPFKVNQSIQYVGGLWTTVIRPRKAQPRTKYPVIVHVYGGPGHAEVQAQMTRRLIDQWLADQGFIVVAIDNRGTPGRGRDFERAVSKRFADIPLADQVKGLKELGKKFPQMDLTRVGVYGWSFGGYMAAQAVLRRPDVFKAAVAGAPVTDWEDYDTHYTERYLGLPSEKNKAYKEASLLTYAKDLERPLLLVHGTADDNVYFRHTLRLADALFREGKDFDILPLSGLTHLLPDPVVMQRLYGKFASYFHKHLGRPVAEKKGGK